MNCEICMKETEETILNVCQECFADIVHEIAKRKSAIAEENKFLSQLLSVMCMTRKSLDMKGRGGKLVIARSIHIVFLKRYMGLTPKQSTARYGLDRASYYACSKIVEQLNLTKADQDKFCELFSAYPKLLENHTIEYNRVNFFKGNSRSK